MEIINAFMRLPKVDVSTNASDPGMISAWQRRMDALILSDPRELMAFICDAILALAAQMKDPEDSVESATEMVVKMMELPEREDVVGLIRDRLFGVIAVAEEQTGFSKADVLEGFHSLYRSAGAGGG